MSTRNHTRQLFTIILLLLISSIYSVAAHAKDDAPLGWGMVPAEVSVASYHPALLSGTQLDPLLGVPINKIGLFAYRHGELIPIPFQIDRKDESGHFLISENITEAAAEPLSAYDECLFMPKDAGESISHLPETLGAIAAQAIRVQMDGESGWVYALAFPNDPPAIDPTIYVHYDAEGDVISSENWRASFSSDLPFLMNTFQWRDWSSDLWSSNIVDTMNVRHTGKMFGMFNFKRTQSDYSSQLVFVKEGPIRIIRGTHNSVYMFLGLSSPTVAINYIAYQHFAVMDTIIDLPFSLDWFFSDLETLTTVDLRNNSSVSGMRILHRTAPDGIAIDGITMPGEHDLWKEKDTDFAISNDFGKILMHMEIEEGLPIQKRIYFVDNMELPNPPEEVPGQFGHSGYATYGWEYVDTGIHHLLFSFTMISARETQTKHHTRNRW